MILTLDKVQKKIGNHSILKEVSFSVEKGKTFVLLGPNGAGKTTTVRMILGLLKPTQGCIQLFGEKINDLHMVGLRKRIGVQSDGNLYGNLSIKENLTIWGKLYGMNQQQCEERLTELLNFFELKKRENAKVGSLSKGMTQKVAIARALFHRPELLILDEPTAGLDPKMTENLIQYLAYLSSKEEMTIMMSTHQLEGLEQLADDVAFIKNGEILISGKVEHLLAEYWSEFEYELETNAIAQTCLVVKKMASSVVPNPPSSVTLTIRDREKIANIIHEMILRNIKIYSVIEKKHTLKDLYFKIMEEANDA